MRTLYLLRHAKASSGEVDGRDFDRTLEPSGCELAAKAGIVLARENLTQLMLLSSPAIRARETTELVLQQLGIDPNVRFDSRIYEADLSSLLTALSDINDDKDSVVLVGHNPGLESLIGFLTGDIRAMPTSGLAKIIIKMKVWSDLDPGDGTLVWLWVG